MVWLIGYGLMAFITFIIECVIFKISFEADANDNTTALRAWFIKPSNFWKTILAGLCWPITCLKIIGACIIFDWGA